MLKKIIKTAALTICIAAITWFVLSWVDIVADNCMMNPTHSEFNAFTVIFGE